MTKTRNTFVHLTNCLVLGMAVSVLVAPRAAAQKTPPGPQDVHVVNAAADPVPVKIDPATNTVKIDGTTNTVKIDGTTNGVKATQAGTWNVGITGTPSVTLSGSSVVSLAAGATVQIDNPASSPALVRNVDRVTAQPVRATLTSQINDGNAATTTFITTYTVPGGKRLVIEFVTASITLPSGQVALFARLDSGAFNAYIAVTPMGNDATGKPVFIGTHRVFEILEPGTVLEVFALRNSGTNPGIVTMTISGYLVDI